MRTPITVLAIVLMLGTTAARARAAEFCGPVSFRAGDGYFEPSSTSDLLLIDVNGDGALDIVAREGETAVMVRLGSGTGTFGPAMYAPTGSTATSLGAADFTGDGTPDLVVARITTAGLGQLRVLNGDGTGTFITGASVPAAVVAAQIVVGDFTGDGVPDVVVGGSQLDGTIPPAVWVHPGTGTGTFGPALASPLARPPAATPEGRFMAAGDFDGDLVLDLAVLTADETTGAIEILLGAGDGSFGPGGFVPLPLGRTLLVDAADVTGDGELDVLSSAHVGDARESRVRVHAGDGAGGLRTTNELTTPSGADTLADLDGDRHLDLLLRAWGPEVPIGRPAGAVMRGDGLGNFAPPQPFHHYTQPYSYGDDELLRAADLDGDGRLDVVIGATSSESFAAITWVMLSTCGNVADLVVSVAESADPHSLPGDVTYVVSVENRGPDPAGVFVDLEEQGLVQGASLIPTHGASCLPYEGVGPRWYCQGGSVPSGATMTITFEVTPEPGTPTGVSVTASSGVSDPNPVDNSAEETTTILSAGAYAFRIASSGGAAHLTWTSGELQAGYIVVRFVEGGAVRFPAAGSLPAGTTSFVDSAPIPQKINCYTVVPVDAGGIPFGRSRMLCAMPGTSSGEAPDFSMGTADIGVRSDGRISDLRWTVPDGVKVAVYVYPLHPVAGPPHYVHPPEGATEVQQAMHFLSPTCYVLFAYTGVVDQNPTVLGWSDALCRVLDFETLPQ